MCIRISIRKMTLIVNVNINQSRTPIHTHSKFNKFNNYSSRPFVSYPNHNTSANQIGVNKSSNSDKPSKHSNNPTRQIKNQNKQNSAPIQFANAAGHILSASNAMRRNTKTKF